MKDKHIRMLLIEDNPGDARWITEELSEVRNESFDVVYADRLSAGFEQLAKDEFDVILLDLGLSDSIGIDTFTKVYERFPEIPVIVLSGLYNEDIAIQAVHVGAQDYLVKGRIDGSVIARVARYAIERKYAEKALRQSEQKYHALMNNAPDAIIVVDVHGNLQEVNKKAEELFGYPRNELLNMHVTALHPADAAGTAAAAFRDIEKKGSISLNDTKVCRKDGGVVPVDITASIIEYADKKVVQGIIRDITERKLSEEALRLTQFSIDHSVVASFLIASDARFLSVNEAGCKLLGYSKEELLSLTLCDVDPYFPRWGWQEHWEDLKREGSMKFESYHRSKGGRIFPVEVTAKYMKFNEKEYDFTFVLDITERKRSEEVLRKANEDLKELDRLKSDFISTVSHELRTPLTVIKEGVNQLLEGIAGETNQRQKDMLSKAIVHIDRLGRIVSDLLDIAKIEARRIAVKTEPVDIVEIAKEVSALFQIRGSEKALEIREFYSHGAIKASVDKDRIAQVFTNIIANALKFTEKGYIEVVVLDKGTYVECSVFDTGKGISEADLPKVFGKFQQFDRMGSSAETGTGLGLAICKGIIELHQGKIWVESKLCSGTKVVFTIPK
jgi:PAS domain S-box-containing protein